MTQEKGVTTRQVAQSLPATLSNRQAMYLLKTIWPDAPETEIIKAAILCQQYGLNPLMRTVYLVKFGKDDWVTLLGIKATRQIAQQALRRRGKHYSYADGPRVMTEDEQKSIRGKVEPDKIWAVTKLKDSDGNTYPGYGWWPVNKQPYGTDKGNDAVNMAFIRSERNATDKMAPGELPDLDVGDDSYIVGDFRAALAEGKQEFLEQTEQDIKDFFPEGETDGEQPPEGTESTPRPTSQESKGNGQEEVEESAHRIDPDWLKQNLHQAKWGQSEVVNWLKSKANYQGLNLGGKFQDIIDRMSKEQAEFLLAEIEDRRAKA